MHKDERVIAEQRKLNSLGLWLVVVMLGAYILFKAIILQAPYQAYSTAVLIFVTILLYMGLAPIVAGIVPQVAHPVKNGIWTGLVTAMIVTILGGITNWSQYHEFYQQQHVMLFGASLIIMFLSAFVLTFILQLALNAVNNSRQKQIERQFDEED